MKTRRIINPLTREVMLDSSLPVSQGKNRGKFSYFVLIFHNRYSKIGTEAPSDIP